MLIQSSPGGGASAKETLPALWIAEYKDEIRNELLMCIMDNNN